MKISDILDSEFYVGSIQDTITVRAYFKLLLSTLFSELESFSGKRPLGDSYWEYDIYLHLVELGVVEGDIKTEGDDKWLGYVDTKYANSVIQALIKNL